MWKVSAARHLRDPDSGTHDGPSVNYDPVLSNGRVEPDSGTTNTTFTYSVDYYDEDGDEPSVKNVYIDDEAHQMDGSGADSTYTYSTKLSYGEHEFYFYFEDGNGGSDRDPNSGSYDGPSVYYAPELSDPTHSPDYGRSETDFTSTVHYYHGGGQAPSRIQVFINDTPHDMSLDSGTASDGVYAWTGKIPQQGFSQYHFEAEDSYGGSAICLRR